MSTWSISPGRPYRGEAEPPPDRYLSHCALALNGLARGKARIERPWWGPDVLATAQVLRAFGVQVRRDSPSEVQVIPPAGGLREPMDVVHAGPSVVASRLALALAASVDGFSLLTADRQVRRHTLEPLVRPLREMGATIDGRASGGHLPMSVRGGDLRMIHHELGNTENIKFPLLIAGTRCGVAFREPHRSRDHAERLLVAMGANLRGAPEGWVVMLPAAQLEPTDVRIPGDLSAAARLLGAAIVTPGSEVYLSRVGINPHRSGVLRVLELFGADVQVYPSSRGGPEPMADLLARHGPLVGAHVPAEVMASAPEDLPLIAVLAAFAEGETRLKGAAEADGDRMWTLLANLHAMGVDAERRRDALIIRGGQPTGTAELDAGGDYIVAMALASVAAGIPGGARISRVYPVSSDYPEFYEDLEALRA